MRAAQARIALAGMFHKGTPTCDLASVLADSRSESSCGGLLFAEASARSYGKSSCKTDYQTCAHHQPGFDPLHVSYQLNEKKFCTSIYF